MKHEEFLKQVKLGATYFKYMNGSPSDGQDDVMKLLAIIEKLKEQRDELNDLSETTNYWDQELDEIVGMG